MPPFEAAALFKFILFYPMTLHGRWKLYSKECTGCLKKKKKKNVGLFWKCYNSFIYGGNLFKFSVVVASWYSFASMMFY